MLNWRHHFNAALVDYFVITIADAGLDDFELNSWERDYSEDAEAAAKAFGEEYELIDVLECRYNHHGV